MAHFSSLCGYTDLSQMGVEMVGNYEFSNGQLPAGVTLQGAHLIVISVTLDRRVENLAFFFFQSKTREIMHDAHRRRRVA